MSPQAGVALTFMGIAMIMLFIAIFTIPSGTAGFYGKIMTLLVALLVFLPVVFIQAYSINCMVEGNCNIFSWIVTAIIIIFSLLYVVVAIRSIYLVRKQKSEVQQDQDSPKQAITIASPVPQTTPATA